MMYRMVKYIAPMVFVFLMLTGNAGAALTRMGDFVYDDIANQYWVSDLSRFAGMSYDQQVNAITNLSLLAPEEIGGWRIAGLSDIMNLMGQGQPMFIGNWSNLFSPLGNGTNGTQFIQGRIERLSTWFYRSFIIQYDSSLPTAYTNAEYLITGIPYLNGDERMFEDWGSPTSFLGAWVVADVASTPLPSSLFLFGAALPVIVYFRRRKEAA
ncbi:MAG: hypothetical protein HUN04_01640 [Desulfobacter sp.]|nr:MAG: hypothetical protein HUN04_01640 [Desulfobacter sp.]